MSQSTGAQMEIHDRARLNRFAVAVAVALAIGVAHGAGAAGDVPAPEADAPAAAAQPYEPPPAAPGSSRTARAWGAAEGQAYRRNWGIEIIGIRVTSSHSMLSFRYRIVDPVKARPIMDQKSKAYVIDEATGVRLAVPAMENIGELRQSGTPEPDRNYFIIFGNPGGLVKAGSRVSVVIGEMHVNGMIAE